MKDNNTLNVYKFDLVGTPKGMQCTQGGERWRKMSCLKEYVTKHIKHLRGENPIKCYSWSLLKVHSLSMQTPTDIWIIVAFKSHAYAFLSYARINLGNHLEVGIVLIKTTHGNM